MSRKTQYKRNIAHHFWWVPKDAIDNLSDESVVEAVLNFGTEREVKELFELYGLEKVANIFYQKSNQLRSNYFPLTKNYFNLYFDRHVQKTFSPKLKLIYSLSLVVLPKTII